MLDFRIETFLHVCKTMNYTKTAEALNITQPGVSQHIKHLETYYNDKLFTYKNKKLALTKAGISLRDAMISIKNDNMHLKNMILESATGEKKLTFGATRTIGDFYLPKKLIHYTQNHPLLRLNFTIRNTKELLTLLEDGKIDFALVEGYFKKSSYESRVLSKEKYILVCAADYPLNTIKDLKELLSHHLLLREDGSGTKEILERFLLEHGYHFTDFKNLSVINSIHFIKQFVLSGYGITFLYEVAVQEEIQKGTMKVVPIEGFDLYHEFNYIWRKNSVFFEFYQDIFTSLLSET